MREDTSRQRRLLRRQNRAVHFQEPDILSVSSNDRPEESKCLTLGRRGHQKIEFAYVHEKKRPILINKIT